MSKTAFAPKLLLPCRVLKGMDSFWQWFKDYLGSLPENLGTDAAFGAEEVPNPKRRRLSFELEGSPRQQMQDAVQQLVSLYNGLGDVANLDDLQGFQELNPWPDHVALRCPPYSPELPSHDPHELGRACPPYIT